MRTSFSIKIFTANKQSWVALSTMEAESMAMTEAAKEAMFLHNLLKSLNITNSNCTIPITLKTDSESAYDHIKNNANHARTKHIDCRHHFIRNSY